jgi:hypothetical protein
LYKISESKVDASEMLLTMEKAKGGRGQLSGGRMERPPDTGISLRDLGITKDQSTQAERPAITMSTKDRVRRWRRRQQRGLIQLTIEIDEIRLVEKLLDVGLVDETSALDRPAVATGAQTLLDQAIPR